VHLSGPPEHAISRKKAEWSGGRYSALVGKDEIHYSPETRATVARRIAEAFFGHPKLLNALRALLLAAITRMHYGIVKATNTGSPRGTETL